MQQKYFSAHIEDDPVFHLLSDERGRVGHGNDSWAFHPMLPLRMVDRYIDAGHDLSVAIFDQVWPDGAFRGESIEDVMNKVWRSVSNWLDEIDAADDERHKSGKAP